MNKNCRAVDRVFNLLTNPEDKVNTRPIEERKLRAAVLQRSIADAALEIELERANRPAWRWIRGDGMYRDPKCEKPFSFERCCEVLELDVAGMREGIEKMFEEYTPAEIRREIFRPVMAAG